MTQARTLNVSHLEPYSVSLNAPLWMGQVVMCLIEGTTFLTFIAMYFYLRMRVDAWPPPGVERPSVLIPTLCLLFLLVSCVGSYIASEGAKASNRTKMIFGLVFNLVLGTAAMCARFYAWADINYTWEANTYGSIVWSILFIHTVEVIGDMIMTAVLLLAVILKRCGPRQRVGVHVDSVLWYFLVGIWIPLHFTIFLGPYWVGVSR